MHLGSMQIQQCNDSSILYAFRYLILEFQYNFDQIDFLLDRILVNYYFYQAFLAATWSPRNLLERLVFQDLKTNKQNEAIITYQAFLAAIWSPRKL